jgi:phage/plasmid-like protein (TIGR03299 family)
MYWKQRFYYQESGTLKISIMAHNINHNSKTGKDAFFSVKEKAWHGLGTIIADYPTSAEAIKHAGLDFAVEKRPLFTVNGENYEIFKDPETDEYMNAFEPNILVPNYYTTMRTDTDEILGVVGKDYHVVQNVDAFSFFDSIVGGKDGILYETAGALGNGERIFITAKLPEYIRVGKSDFIEQFLFLTTSHDGFGSITASFTPIRICCQNTLNAALKTQTGAVKIRHTANAHERLKQAHQLLGITNQLSGEMEQLFNHWSKVKITDKQVKKLVQMALAPNKETLDNIKKGRQDEFSSVFNNMVDKVLEYSATSPTQQLDTTKGTLFGTYNSVTGYFQNVKNFKNDEAKFNSIMSGSALGKAQATFDLCNDFARIGVNALN